MDNRKILFLLIAIVAVFVIARAARGSTLFARYQTAKLPWKYRFQVLPHLPDQWTTAGAINDNGDIIGTLGPPLGSPSRLVRWKAGVETPIPKPIASDPASTIFTATGVNALGDAAGRVTPFSDDDKNDTSDEEEDDDILSQAIFCSRDNKIVGLVPADKESRATGINASAQVVGWYEQKRTDTSASSLNYNSYKNRHAFLWQNGALQDIDPDYKYGSVAVSINDQGQVVFLRYTGVKSGPGILNQCFPWDRGKVTAIAELAGNQNTPVKINNHSQILAMIDDTTPVIWDKGKMTKISKLPGKNAWHLPRIGYGYDSFAQDMNDRGEVVGKGASTTRLNMVGMPDDAGFLFSGGKLYDLDNFLLTGSEYYIERAESINDRGDIVGIAKKKTGGEPCAFVLLRENK